MADLAFYCFWCGFIIPHAEFDFCPRCFGSFTYHPPEVLILGAYI